MQIGRYRIFLEDQVCASKVLMKLDELRWHSRRGLKELDDLLKGYLDRHYPEASSEERQRFEDWLKAPDPWLWSKLTKPPPEDPLEQALIRKIRGHA